jgi:hypothetical protein
MSYTRTPEHRARQAERIKQWKPWEKSTGPRTEEGKARAAMRGYKGALRPKMRQECKRLTAEAMAQLAMRKAREQARWELYRALMLGGE